MQWLMLLVVSCMACAASAQLQPFCRNEYDLRGQYCYRLYLIAEDFSEANRSCVRDGTNLLSIDDQEENAFIRNTYIGPNSTATEFWIGLNDINTEGVFRWLNLNASQPTYVNWADDSPSDTNSNSFDCVKFTSGGWRVHQGFCGTSSLPHICKAPSCMSLDNVNCHGSEPTTASPGVAVEVVVIPVVLVIALVLIIVLVLVLVGLWKFNNDAFQRYCCCCLKGSKSAAVHNIQQENQRLRRELSQHKISMSGRYQPGQLGDSLSGVPDGRGGVLPAIKRPLAASRFSPTTEEDRMLSLAGGQVPPPLVPQRPSLVSPMSRQTSQSFFFGAPPNPPARPVRQSLPGSFVMPSRPSIPAPVRGGSLPAPVRGGPGPRVARESLTREGEGEGDTASETSKSQPEDNAS